MFIDKLIGYTLIVSLFFIHLSSAQIHLSGSLSGTLEPGEYIIDDQIQVDSSETLIMQPGVHFKFSGRYKFIVYGRLEAIGTESDSIIFTRQYPDEATKWKGIRILSNQSDTSKFSYCIIEYGKVDSISDRRGGGIYCEFANIIIEHCTIRNNQALGYTTFGIPYAGAMYLKNSHVVIKESLFQNNICSSHGGGHGGAIYMNICSGLIYGCDFIDNQAIVEVYGVSSGGAIRMNNSPVDIKFCNFIQNYAEHSGAVFIMGCNSEIVGCNFYHNSAEGYGVLHIDEFDGVVESCKIINNHTEFNGGGLYLYYFDASIENCEISNNTTDGEGGGIYISGYSSVNILNSEICDNNAGENGSGIHSSGNPSNISIDNCTISGNSTLSSTAGANIYVGAYMDFSMSNSIVTHSQSGAGIYFANIEECQVEYCDFYDNERGNFAGNFPAMIERILYVNQNNDSCDIFSNIFLDPCFIDQSEGYYHLSEISPCIDAGNPASGLDPDNTIADIGAYYFHQGLEITLTPIDTPIVIPAEGGSFDFLLEASNSGINIYNFDIWTVATLSNISLYDSLKFRECSLLTGDSVSCILNQVVRPETPPGVYTYNACIGVYPEIILSEDCFTVEKTDILHTEVGNKFTPKSYSLQFLPNPFNPSTNITFNLPEAGLVSLSVYDITGRQVAKLVEGMKPNGQHQIVFNASNLSSGVYFARLVAGNFKQVRKMLLVK